jgi:undecaprenyl-diphosphatase
MKKQLPIVAGAASVGVLGVTLQVLDAAATTRGVRAKLPGSSRDSFPAGGHRMSSIRKLFAWVGSHELAVIVALLLVCGGVWAFVEIADEVQEGETADLDRRIILALRNPDDLSDPIGSRGIEEMMRDFTGLGGVAMVTLLAAAATLYLWIERKTGAMWFVLIAVLGGLAVSLLLKAGFDRPRPDLVPHGSHVYTTSFPSGHSIMSAVTYLTLGALLARFHEGRLQKAFFLGVAVAITLAVGCSRVYLGVHWPTDVLAGWTVGGTWALLCWLTARLLQRRGTVDLATDDEHTSA